MGVKPQRADPTPRVLHGCRGDKTQPLPAATPSGHKSALGRMHNIFWKIISKLLCPVCKTASWRPPPSPAQPPEHQAPLHTASGSLRNCSPAPRGLARRGQGNATSSDPEQPSTDKGRWHREGSQDSSQMVQDAGCWSPGSDFGGLVPPRHRGAKRSARMPAACASRTLLERPSQKHHCLQARRGGASQSCPYLINRLNLTKSPNTWNGNPSNEAYFLRAAPLFPNTEHRRYERV